MTNLTLTLLFLALMLTLSVTMYVIRGLSAVKQNPALSKALGRRMLLTSVLFVLVPVAILLGRGTWGDMVGLYAFVAALVAANLLWFRPIR